METQLALEILEIIQKNYKYIPSEDNYLLMRHIQLFAHRYLNHQQLTKSFSNLYDTNKEDIAKTKETIDQINDFLISNYSFNLTRYEGICFSLHLCNLELQ